MKVTAGGGEQTASKKFIGMAPVQVIAINPTRDELEMIYGKVMEKEPVYTWEKDGRRSALINPILKTTIGLDGKCIITDRLKIWISSDLCLFTKDGVESCRVIDEYGECANVTKDEFVAALPPKKGRVVGKYRPAKRGEETLMQFIKTWLNVAFSSKWDSNLKKFVPADAKDLEKAKLEYDWDQWLDGDFSDLKALVDANKDHILQVCFGIEKGDDNNYYQAVFDQYFMRSWESKPSNYDWMQKQIDRYLESETVKLNKETNEKIKVKRSEIFQFSSDLVTVWELPVKKNEVPQNVVANPEKKDANNVFLEAVKAQEKPAVSTDTLPPIPGNEPPEEFLGTNDLPF